jgi:hypothetical protein
VFGLTRRRRSPLRTLAAAIIALSVLGYRLFNRPADASRFEVVLVSALAAVVVVIVALALISLIRRSKQS